MKLKFVYLLFQLEWPGKEYDKMRLPRLFCSWSVKQRSFWTQASLSCANADVTYIVLINNSADGDYHTEPKK